jgi:hypothetical protein
VLTFASLRLGGGDGESERGRWREGEGEMGRWGEGDGEIGKVGKVGKIFLSLKP